MPNIDLTDPEIIKDLLSIQNASPQSDISILYASLDEESQTLHLPAASSLNELSTTQTVPTSKQAPAPDATDTRVTIGGYDTANAVHAVGSYTKVVIAYAMACFLELNSRYSWNSLAQDVFNDLRVEREGEGASRIELCGKPTLKQLLCHWNGFAPMNKIFFAPDGTFLLTQKEFLRIAPAFTEYYHRNHEPPWYEYSNANYIFAGIILELWKGKDLKVVLEEQVFKKLGMNSTTIDPVRVKGFRASERLVEGSQISSVGSRIPVPPDNLLQDSTESGSMGLRTSLKDLASFNMELLRRIGAKRYLNDGAEDPFRFFDGVTTSIAGFVSHPSERIFQSETPTRHLFPAGYESVLLPKQPWSMRLRAWLKKKFTKEKLIRGAITHKAGYIDGYSCNVIVSEDDRDLLIVLANSTGPFDVVHHISLYLLQETFDLKPRINVPREGEKEGLICSTTLRELEERNLAYMHPQHKPEKLAGTYRHTQWEQQITLEPDGGVFFHGAEKRSRTTMALTFISNNVIRVLVQGKSLYIEGWSVWQNMDFVIAHRDGHDCLVQRYRDERGGKVEEVEDVYRKVHN